MLFRTDKHLSCCRVIPFLQVKTRRLLRAVWSAEFHLQQGCCTSSGESFTVIVTCHVNNDIKNNSKMVGLRSCVTGVARLHCPRSRSAHSSPLDVQRRTRGSASLARTSMTLPVASSILREICLRSTARRSLWRRLLFSRFARLTRLFLPNTPSPSFGN